MFPYQFLRTNAIFNVARAAGMHTAWSDKHPNEIHGKRSDGTEAAPGPAIFGMNFQAVSVAQTLVDPVKSCQRNPTSTCDPGYVPGGYAPGTLEFTPQLAQALSYVDGAIGSMVDAVRGEGLLRSTELIISAKHGQSPIDPAKLARTGDQVTTVLTAAGIQVAQNTTDDVALVRPKDQHQSTAAVEALQADKAGANTARVDFILSGAALVERFGDPLDNSRTPDLIVQPTPGTIYARSKAKVAEHGGFAEDDTHVALLVVDGSRRVDRGRDEAQDRRVSAPVRTTQIAPTILAFLGLDPSALQSVRAERTRVLPL